MLNDLPSHPSEPSTSIIEIDTDNILPAFNMGGLPVSEPPQNTAVICQDDDEEGDVRDVRNRMSLYIRLTEQRSLLPENQQDHTILCCSRYCLTPLATNIFSLKHILAVADRSS
jgi:hypothetical protein